MFETAPGWLLFLLYPAIVAALVVVWLITRGSSTELNLKGFGVELTLKENRSKEAGVNRAPKGTTAGTKTNED